MFLQEPDQVLAGDSAILGTGNPVSAESARIEPLTDGAWRDLANFCNLTSSEDRPHCGLSNHNLSGSELLCSRSSPLDRQHGRLS